MKIDMAALREAETQRGVPAEAILDAVSAALLTAYLSMGGHRDARVDIDRDTGTVRVLAQEVDVDSRTISEWDDTPRGFSRIATAVAHRVIRRTPLAPHVRDELAERVFNMVSE